MPNNTFNFAHKKHGPDAPHKAAARPLTQPLWSMRIMKSSVIILMTLVVSLGVNILLYFQTAVQSDSLKFLSSSKEELKIFSTLIPDDMSKETIKEKLSNSGYIFDSSGEYYNAPKPNSTLVKDNTYFIFNSNNVLIQINSRTNSLEPIYEKP